MKNRKQLLADFYLELLGMPKSTPNNNFVSLRLETLKALANELDSDMNTVERIFERMAQEDETDYKPQNSARARGA